MGGRQALKRVPRFREFSDSDLDLILQRLMRRNYQPGEVILHYGARGDFMSIVAQGEIEVAAPAWHNHRRLATLRTGDFFGEANLQNGVRASATLRAAVPTKLLILRKVDFERVPIRRSAPGDLLSALPLPPLAPIKRLPRPLLAFLLLSLLFIITGMAAFSPPVRYMRATVYYALGNHYLGKESLGEAARCFEKSLSSGVRQAAAHNNAGFVYDRQGRLAEATQAFSVAINLDPTFGAAYNNLGVLYHKLGKSDEAVALLLQATRLEPNNALSHHNLGVAYHAQGNLVEAAQQYREALRIAPTLPNSHCNLGSIYFSEGNLADAAGEFTSALQADPEMFIAHGGLGAVYYEQGELDEALYHFARSVELDPDYGVGHFYLGLIYEETGQKAEAETSFKRAVSVRGDNKVKEQAWEHLKRLWNPEGEAQ